MRISLENLLKDHKLVSVISMPHMLCSMHLLEELDVAL